MADKSTILVRADRLQLGMVATNGLMVVGIRYSPERLGVSDSAGLPADIFVGAATRTVELQFADNPDGVSCDAAVVPCNTMVAIRRRRGPRGGKAEPPATLDAPPAVASKPVRGKNA